MRLIRRRASVAPTADMPPHAARICLLAAAERRIAEIVARYPGVETGGVLAGFDDSSLGAIVIVGASGPGAWAQHAPYRFNRDPQHCQRWLDECVTASSGVLDFVGEWHSHPEPNPEASTVDIRSHVALAANPACHRTLLVMLIAGSRHARRTGSTHYTRSHVWSVRHDGVARRRLDVLPDSAYRDLLAAVNHGDRVAGGTSQLPFGPGAAAP